MIFKKHKLQLKYPDSTFWNQNFGKGSKEVRGRKYGIKTVGNKITIERKIKDIFDTMGFVPFKMIGIAKGDIKKEDNQFIVRLSIEIKLIFEIIFTVFGSLLSLNPILISLENFESGLMLGLFVFIFVTIIYLLFNHGLNEFKYDLENDLKHLENKNKTSA